MTTETELRDLLAAEAGGPTRVPAGWDDVTRRGRHRAQMRRVQNLALLAVVAGGAITAIALSADDATVRTVPPATEPAPTVPAEIDPSTVLQFGAQISRARAQGTSVKLFFPDLSPCSGRRPVVVESEDQIVVGLVGEQDERGIPWADCASGQDDPNRGPAVAWGAIDLRDPVADRPLVDLSTGQTVAVTDSADLLFPTILPAPFDLDVVTEREPLLGEPGETWIFEFPAEWPQTVSLYSSSDLEANGSGCGGQVVEVRGTEGCFSEAPLANLAWDEDGRAIYLSMVSSNVEGSYLDDLLAIAEGLEPLEG